MKHHHHTPEKRQRLLHVGGTVYQMLTTCWCGATRIELVSYHDHGHGPHLIMTSEWRIVVEK